MAGSPPVLDRSTPRYDRMAHLGPNAGCPFVSDLPESSDPEFYTVARLLEGRLSVSCDYGCWPAVAGADAHSCLGGWEPVVMYCALRLAAQVLETGEGRAAHCADFRI